MRLLAPACVVSCLFAATLHAGEISLNGHTFTLPDGFSIELIAGPPLVDRPITADFDEQGRLYVSDSSGSNEKTAVQLEQKPHRILRLEDTDGDGRFDKQIVYADRMMFPEGTMWFDGSLYVAAPPSIWKLTDTDGDGVADQRMEWFQGKTLTGCANDLHGPYLGPDGFIYWCKGAFAEQTYEFSVPAGRADKKKFVTKASHIFRCRPDGSDLEPVMTGGMDNPVDVVFTPEGDRIFTTTFLQHPAEGKRDGLIHAIYGGVYGKDQAVLDGHIRTGELMPPLSHMGAAAPCGLTAYESTVFGKEYENNLFACSFNMHKVSRHELTRTGGTFESRDSDFLVSNNIDFHPTDILTDADGSLVVIDTGGWYKLCCPTSQLWKPDVLGGIYRVRKAGAPKVDDPRGLKVEWAGVSVRTLVSFFDDDRPRVRWRAVRECWKRGDKQEDQELVANLRPESNGMRRNPRTEQMKLWALSGIAGQSSFIASEVIREHTLIASDDRVRLVVLHIVSLLRNGATNQIQEDLLRAPEFRGSPAVLRASFEALGRVNALNHRAHYLAYYAHRELDRATEHSLIYALIEVADPEATRLVLAGQPRAQRVALIALDQMQNGGLTAADVAPYLASSDSMLRETASWIVDHHPEWGDSLADFLTQRLKSDLSTDAERTELTKQLARFARAATVQNVMGATLADASASTGVRRVVLDAMSASGLKELPANWFAAILPVLQQGPEDLLASAVATVHAVPPPKDKIGELSAALIGVAHKAERLPVVRVAALAAVPGGLTQVDAELFQLLKQSAPAEQDVLLRSRAADTLSRSKFTTPQLAELTEVFGQIGPLEADRVLAAFKDCADEQVGLKMVAALKDSPAVTALRIDTLKAALAKLPASVQEQAKAVYAALNIDPEQQKAKLDALFSSLKPGDIRRGQAIFHSQKASCAVCHAMGYLGGTIGPDLTRVGGIRTERDLLEAIVFPNASFVRSYEPVTVVTTAGKVINGILKSDGAEVIVTIGAKEEARIPRDEVDEIRPGNVSVMPSGLDQQLSPQDLADLIAFLKGAK